MFTKEAGVTDYVESNIRPKVEKETQIEEELSKPVQSRREKRMKIKQDKKIMKMVDQKRLELSFEVKEVRDKIPEIEEVRATIDKGEEAIALYLKAGRPAEAKKLKKSLQDAKYEIELLDVVMNLDFTKPKGKAKKNRKSSNAGRSPNSVLPSRKLPGFSIPKKSS